MRETMADSQMAAYSEAVRTGMYAKASGLEGKYDNVRRFWEDELTQRHLRPHIEALIERTRAKGRGVRIMDLGCGSADGYELLRGIRQRDANLIDLDVSVLNGQWLELYCGVDLNDDLLEQASDIYSGSPRMRFEQADFTRGLGFGRDRRPYDLYLMTYGTTSHHTDDETLIELFVEIADRARDHCFVVCDWLGRYSYEWQTLWAKDLAQNRNMDYVVSYIYDEEEREARRDELDHLTLRLMSRDEIDRIVSEAGRRSGVPIKPLEFFDRSTFVGRHMDTGDYNPHAQPIRKAINSLLERNTRTSLESLLIDYVPKSGFGFPNNYFEEVASCWNALVEYVGQLLELYDEQGRRYRPSLPSHAEPYPPPLCRMMARMQVVVGHVGWLDTCRPRENIIEPQLAKALRRLVTELQQGQGCAHGLVGVFEVEKSG